MGSHLLTNCLGEALIETSWGFICDLGKAFYNPKMSDVVYDHTPVTMTRVIKRFPCFG